jgi:ubiquinone/menaquinone biosynthesis C-methylase UbiE
MKLHLGCGTKILDGFINVDVRKKEKVDIVADISNLSMFDKNSIHTIYACHVLEHINRHEYMNTLNHWYELLVPGGILRLSVPDMEMVFQNYNIHKDLNLLKGFIWGGQTYKENFHYCGWDLKTISQDLSEIGFSDISRYDWRQTEHAHIDDYSQCYLPHMDKENGILMSLNIEAKK